MPCHRETNQSPTKEALQVASLGACAIESPLNLSTNLGDGKVNYVSDSLRVLYHVEVCNGETVDPQLSFEHAGPRKKLFFDPKQSKAAVVTCGGLCPGLNNVVRSLYYELNRNYGVPTVLGIRYGYRGLNPKLAESPLELSPERVDESHKLGGTLLGTSRGPQEPSVIVDFLVSENINMLFCVGGDGTQRGAHSIAEEISKRKLNISIIGIPKTIDNDIKYVWRTFGFATAVAEAEKVIDCAHTEAKAIQHGIGLVKLMGREAGFIAAAASLASGQVDFVLIPEVPFTLEGERGLLAKLERRLKRHQHAVIVVAEGAGQDLLAGLENEKNDASGNKKLRDIGPFLKEQILSHFAKGAINAKVKYLDPSYNIRSTPANAFDSVMCDQFARHAAHAAMCGKTDMLVGYWHNQFVHVPLPVSTGAIKKVSPEGDLWMAVLATTRQESWR